MKPAGIGPMVLLLLLGSGTVGAAEPDSSSCLDALLHVRPNAPVVLAVKGTAIRGEFLRVDAERAEVWLRTFDAGASRYDRVMVPGPDIQGVGLLETRKSGWYPVVGAVGLAGLGVAFGLSLPETDGGAAIRGIAIPLGMIGLLVGSTFGAILAPEQTVSRHLDCGP